ARAARGRLSSAITGPRLYAESRTRPTNMRAAGKESGAESRIVSARVDRSRGSRILLLRDNVPVGVIFLCSLSLPACGATGAATGPAAASRAGGVPAQGPGVFAGCRIDTKGQRRFILCNDDALVVQVDPVPPDSSSERQVIDLAVRQSGRER